MGNAVSCRTAIGIHHHAGRLSHCVGDARHPRDIGMGTGKPCPERVREGRVGLLLCLDALRARHERPVLAHPRGARIAEPAIGLVGVVEDPETRNGGWLC